MCNASLRRTRASGKADGNVGYALPKHGSPRQDEGKKSSSDMLMKDCLGLELLVVDNGPVIHKPDASKDVAVILALNIGPVTAWTLDNVRTIRGPPPDWPSHFQTQPSIILTTQRLRI
ncbi:hypothetical protein [Micavibrio aeruginosavorus]|uniref:hypothetical protein n=1 Tax=Micavibrio aeruginosavorus TaxID=349221 RepID=UPI0011D29EB2|nr:hypothetical protein [Micavibrio aeruginosavorus]